MEGCLYWGLHTSQEEMLRLLTEHSEGLVKEIHCKMDLTTD